MKFNIFTKFFLVVGAAVITVGVAAIIITVRERESLVNQLYHDRALSLASSLDAGVTDKDLDDPESLKPTLLKLLLLNSEILEINVYKRMPDGALEIIVSTTTAPADSESVSGDTQRALNEGQAIFRKDEYRGHSVLELFSPVHVSGNAVGVYQIIISLTELEIFLTAQIRNIVGLVILAVGVFFLALLVFVRWVISKPLEKVNAAAKRIEAEDFDIEVPVKSKDEIGSLAESFHEMAQKLKYSYGELGKRVEEKTKELSQALATSEVQNKRLEDNKLAMTNILEDEKELEEELRVEKASIEQKVIERTNELNEEKAKLTASIESLIRAYVMIDTGGNVILTNHQLADLLGKPEGIWTLGKIQEKLGETYDLATAYKDCLADKKLVVVKGLSFGIKYIDIFVLPVFLAGKDLIGVLVLLGDVTEEKILARSRDEFFSIASHELRTPLTAIRGNASLIKQFYGKDLKDPDLVEMINDIEESSVRLIDIVNDFLNVSRLEQGKIQFKPENFDLVKLSEDSLKQYEVTGSRKKLYLNFEKSLETIPEVYGDVDRTRQVLINLIGNGLKFTENGGVTVQISRKDGFACVFVTDTGRGIPAANQSLLFRKFQQAGSSLYTRDTTKGTGLGLYISKLMIGGMGGKIWLEKSQEGRGLTFAFCLPIAKKAEVSDNNRDGKGADN